MQRHGIGGESRRSAPAGTHRLGRGCSPTRPWAPAAAATPAIAQILGSQSTRGTASTSASREPHAALHRPRLPSAASQRPQRPARRAAPGSASGIRLQRPGAPTTPTSLPTLIIAADGLGSRFRSKVRRHLPARYRSAPLLLRLAGLRRNCSDAFTFAFETARGWFRAHAYRFDGTTPTFIVGRPTVWRATGWSR